MHRSSPALLSSCCIALLAGAAHAGEEPALRLTLRNVAPGKGQLLVGVCRKEEFLGSRCAFTTVVPAQSNPQVIIVPKARLAPGRYAVQVVHDRDADGRLDTNVLGIPSEPVGFSRNAVGRFGPPKFDSAAIDYDGQPLDLTIDLG